MAVRPPERPPELPVFLQQRSTDEYDPLPHSATVRRTIARVRAEGPDNASRLSLPLSYYWTTRQGRAAALHALDQEWGGGFYNVPEEAALDRDAAEAALGGQELVIDVQTHYISYRPDYIRKSIFVPRMVESIASDHWKGFDKLVYAQAEVGYNLAEYLRCVFLECENSVVVLSSGPGVEGKPGGRNLNNSEMIGTRELIDRMAGTGRLINHCVIHPNVTGEFDLMNGWGEWCDPAGWKVYTKYGAEGYDLTDGKRPEWTTGMWALDDEESGRPFLKRVMDSGVRVVAAHKGISVGVDTGWSGASSPRDIGPSAIAFPDITFMVYHSGYEPREGDEEEGPYSEEVAHIGTNRLVTSLKEAGIGPGSNVYAELGSTWYLLMSHPREAAHVMGKLLLALGEDNIVWGTDSCFYGPPQGMLDGFRAFQIPEEYCQRYGYPQLTPTAKEKILGLNAARIYGINPEEARYRAQNDELAWVKAALEEYSARGTASIV